MSFLSPFAFAFAAAIPVVIVFYLLKRKRTVRLVSSTLLWQKFLAESQASAPFQRLRHNWLLILQCLMLALAVLALARPYFAGKIRGGRLFVVILDTSASMQSLDESPSRFEQARRQALQLVDSLHDNDRMVVLQSAAVTEVKQSATGNKAALRRALLSCAVTDGPTRLVEALKLAETLTRDQPGAEIHLFSDGAVASLGEFENKGLRLLFHRLGTRANNLGLVSLEVRAHPEDPARRAIYTRVFNASTNAAATEVELRFEDVLLETRSVTVPPRQTVPLVFAAAQRRDGIFSVRLTAHDDLAADNLASVVSLLPQPVKVLLVSPGNQILAKALRAAPNVELSLADHLTDPASDFDIVVLDGVVPAVWPGANVLAFHTANTNWFPTWSRLETPAIVDWKNTHPLLRFVNFDNVQIGDCLQVKTPTWAVSLADAPQTPLILAGELARQRIVWVGFDPLQSTWPLRIGFPIFVVNAIEWLNPASARAGQLLVRAGEPFRLALTQPLTNGSVTLPDGAVRKLAADPKAREVVFGDTARRGIYRVSLGTNQFEFCANVLDAAETDTIPRAELKLGKYAKVAATTVRRASVELWRWIAAGALGVLLLEWWWYHKRTA
ncbi:MAG: VWA domain-containing protein [Verrucomicrobia bacterium]|nr:VWA domain-containing protein [Verrucomicrobiota bacterium]